MHDQSPPSVPELLSQHIEEALKNRHTHNRYAAFRTALAEILGLPRTDLGIGAVTDVNRTLDRRLDDWRSIPVTVLILNHPSASQAAHEVRRAKVKVERVIGLGDPPRRAVILYARQPEGETPAWTVRAVVELALKKRRPTITEALNEHYPHLDRTLIREFGEGIAWGSSPSLKTTRTQHPPYTIEEAASDLFITPDAFARMRDTLFRKKNVVLEGSPGVGKTFLARRLADAVVGQRDSRYVHMVQFHPSYSYEDFVRGWRPGAGGRLELQNGIFLNFCHAAQQVATQPFIFIIDEINRGNLAKIFGELLMLVESDKRDSYYAMPLAYTEQHHGKFFVPPNVFLLGLMNTADRSLAMVDYALRRRFAFIQLSPAFESERFVDYLDRRGASGMLIKRIQTEMAELNELIQHSRQLGPKYVIGHSYFVPIAADQSLDDAWYASILDTEIVPLLYEYWSDNPSMLERSLKVLGKDTSR